jgi:hypothetical protein
MTDYLRLSKIFYSPIGKTARLVPPNPATAELMRRADTHRTQLKGLAYDDFIEILSQLTDTPQPFTIDGISADWFATYNFIHNGRMSADWLVKILEASPAGQIIPLPVSPQTIRSLNISEEVMIDLISLGEAIATVYL